MAINRANQEWPNGEVHDLSGTAGTADKAGVLTFYRFDNVRNGNITLTIERGHLTVERKQGKVSEMTAYRRLHYPNAHNWRAHHIAGCELTECDVCSRAGARGRI